MTKTSKNVIISYMMKNKALRYRVIIQGVRDQDLFSQCIFSFENLNEANQWRDYEIDTRGNRAWIEDLGAY